MNLKGEVPHWGHDYIYTTHTVKIPKNGLKDWTNGVPFFQCPTKILIRYSNRMKTRVSILFMITQFPRWRELLLDGYEGCIQPIRARIWCRKSWGLAKTFLKLTMHFNSRIIQLEWIKISATLIFATWLSYDVWMCVRECTVAIDFIQYWGIRQHRTATVRGPNGFTPS